MSRDPKFGCSYARYLQRFVSRNVYKYIINVQKMLIMMYTKVMSLFWYFYRHIHIWSRRLWKYVDTIIENIYRELKTLWQKEKLLIIMWMRVKHRYTILGVDIYNELHNVKDKIIPVLYRHEVVFSDWIIDKALMPFSTTFHSVI